MIISNVAAERAFEAVDEFGGAEGVSEEHGDGHGADAAGDGGDVGGDFGDCVEVDVADGFFGDAPEGVGDADAVEADVDDDGAGLDVAGFDEPGLSDGDDDDVGAASGGFGVFSVDVAEGNGGVALGEQERERAADDAGGSDDGDVGGLEGDAGGVDEFDDGEGGAGGDDGVAVDDVADVGGVDAFDILDDIDLILGFLKVEIVREWGVEEDAGDGGVLVEGVDGGVELLFGGGVGEGVELVFDADLGAGFTLVFSVDEGGGVVADEDGGETDGFALCCQRSDFFRDLFTDGCGESFSVDEFGGHRYLPQRVIEGTETHRGFILFRVCRRGVCRLGGVGRSGVRLLF